MQDADVRVVRLSDPTGRIAPAIREKRNIGEWLQDVSGGSVVFLCTELDCSGGVARQIDAAIV